ncbi:hypothetical protein [Nonomuraea dietziae]|uniref:hypothetical protein n=1 Tax=Nonomuraea dietziae TaxID=65515 RepID=UPI00343AEFCE
MIWLARGITRFWVAVGSVDSLINTGASRRSAQAGLVVAAGHPVDDAEPVVGVDQGDDQHQGGELVVVVMLGGVGPGLVGDAAGAVGDAGR